MSTYVFDIDGTLADPSHRLHHILRDDPDWAAFFAAVHLDPPIPHVVGLVRDLLDDGLGCVLFVSGRSDECRPATEEWLLRHVGVAGPLYMRRAGDHRPDHVVKMELLAELRANGHHPAMAFDDRDTVVAAWRAAGVPCAQVAPGDF